MIDDGLKERFNAKWVEAENGCWLWTGAKAGIGYGEIKATRSRHYLYAHRISWELAYGPIPAGMYVLHRCDVPACVNPAHLFLGDGADNQRDMARKNRHLFGERNAQAKMTEADVLRIYELSDAGMSQKRIGAVIGVGQMTVCRVLRGERWAHLHRRERRGTSDPA